MKKSSSSSEVEHITNSGAKEAIVDLGKRMEESEPLRRNTTQVSAREQTKENSGKTTPSAQLRANTVESCKLGAAQPTKIDLTGKKTPTSIAQVNDLEIQQFEKKELENRSRLNSMTNILKNFTDEGDIK